MSVIMQEISIDVEKINKTGYPNIDPDEPPAQSTGGTAGFPASPHRQPLEAMPDLEYVRSMEERYGIREEGVF